MSISARHTVTDTCYPNISFLRHFNIPTSNNVVPLCRHYLSTEQEEFAAIQRRLDLCRITCLSFEPNATGYLLFYCTRGSLAYRTLRGWMGGCFLGDSTWRQPIHVTFISQHISTSKMGIGQYQCITP